MSPYHINIFLSSWIFANKILVSPANKQMQLENWFISFYPDFSIQKALFDLVFVKFISQLMNWPVKSQRVLLQGAWMYLTASCVHYSLVSTIYSLSFSVFGNLKVDNVGKYLENFLGVDTVYSNNERSGRQLARVVSMSAELCWSAGEQERVGCCC